MQIKNDLRLNLTAFEYKNAADIFTDLCLNVGVLREDIGYFGQIGFPGISDLDALVMGSPEQIRKIIFKFQAQRDSDADFKYIFWHVPVFVLKEAEQGLGALHTLQNLNWLEEKSFTEGISDQRLLNLIWYISLLQTFAEILRMGDKGIPVSLRLLLLVYSNLWYSSMIFGEDLGGIPQDLTSSDSLRRAVVSGDKMDESFIQRSFITLLEFSYKAFDAHCYTQWKGEFENSSSGSFLISAGTRFVYGNRSEIEDSKFGIKSIVLNPIGFQLVKDYLDGESKSEVFQRYCESVQEIKLIYRKYDLTYPFVEPFRFSENQMKRRVVNFFNMFNASEFI